MSFRRTVQVALAISCLAWAQTGVRPRSDLAEYPFLGDADSATVGAALLTTEQARRALGVDLSRYVVVEVGVFPEDGQTVSVSANDFALKFGSGRMLVRAEIPLVSGAAPGSDVVVLRAGTRERSQARAAAPKAAATLPHKVLPTTRTVRPVAGYLFFPVPTTLGLQAPYLLDYYGGTRRISLALK